MSKLTRALAVLLFFVWSGAVAAQKAGNGKRAHDLYTQLIRKYPRSDEAALARDRIKTIK